MKHHCMDFCVVIVRNTEYYGHGVWRGQAAYVADPPRLGDPEGSPPISADRCIPSPSIIMCPVSSN